MTNSLPPENPYGHTKKLRFILDTLSGHSRQAVVLDFGCGNGTAVTSYLAERFNLVIGVEPDADCRRHAQALVPDAFFYESLDMPFRNVSVVVCADVIEHLKDPYFVLKHISNLQQPGDLLIGSVPNGRGPFEIENRLYRSPIGLPLSMAVEITLNPWRLIRPKRSTVPYNNASPHLHFFTLEQLEYIASAVGYGVVRIQPGVVFGSPPITAHFLEKSAALMDWNGRLANYLPLWAVSSWLFVWVKR